MYENLICNNVTWRTLSNVELVLWPRLRVGFAHISDPVVGDLPGIAQQRRQNTFYYCLMAVWTGLGDPDWKMSFPSLVFPVSCNLIYVHASPLCPPISTCKKKIAYWLLDYVVFLKINLNLNSQFIYHISVPLNYNFSRKSQHKH
jgi:hypothetical protein